MASTPGCTFSSTSSSSPVRRSSAHAQLKRQWRLLHVLAKRTSGARVSSLARWLGVEKETVARDLKALQLAGFPLARCKETDHAQAERWFIHDAEMRRCLVRLAPVWWQDPDPSSTDESRRFMVVEFKKRGAA